ncbi:hypothetical protein [Tsukamurella sp. 1534]|uniref:hypothetical protein n=1 Tax=Tsukamurella sp. 1534 TaxID=1151061 RepID=UPI00030AB37F|nr:hypothetical protein [Tsukamurella sp. 1534]
MRTSALWISGAPGTGKTTTGWRVFELLTAAGRNAAYVDIDQLGMLGPFERLSGAAPHLVKEANAARLIESLRDCGLRQMIVSGIVDPEVGITRFEERASAAGVDPTHVRLHCDWAELRRRYLARGSDPETLAELASVAERYDTGTGDSVDTTRAGVDEVAHDLLDRHCAISDAPLVPAPSVPAAPIPTTVLHGATAAGKSTVGWELVRRRWATGRATAFIDVEQLGFHGPAYSRRVHANAYAAVTLGYADAGATDIIAVTRDPGLVADARGGGPVTRVLLDADAEPLADRVALRSQTSTGRLPGDELLGIGPDRQRVVADRANREAARFRHSGDHDLVVDTNHLAPAEAADLIERTLADRSRPC